MVVAAASWAPRVAQAQWLQRCEPKVTTTYCATPSSCCSQPWGSGTDPDSRVAEEIAAWRSCTAAALADDPLAERAPVSPSKGDSMDTMPGYSDVRAGGCALDEGSRLEVCVAPLLWAHRLSAELSREARAASLLLPLCFAVHQYHLRQNQKALDGFSSAAFWSRTPVSACRRKQNPEAWRLRSDSVADVPYATPRPGLLCELFACLSRFMSFQIVVAQMWVFRACLSVVGACMFRPPPPREVAK